MKNRLLQKMKKKRDSSKDRIRRRGRGKNGRMEEWKNGRMAFQLAVLQLF